MLRLTRDGEKPVSDGEKPVTEGMTVSLGAEAHAVGDAVQEEMAAATEAHWDAVTQEELNRSLDIAFKHLQGMVCESIGILGHELKAAKSRGEKQGVIKTIFSCWGQTTRARVRGQRYAPAQGPTTEADRRLEEAAEAKLAQLGAWALADPEQAGAGGDRGSEDDSEE